MSGDEQAEAWLRAWHVRDAKRAVLPGDRTALERAGAARLLVVELAVREPSRDLFHACAMLGQLLAAEGASPTFAAGTLAELAAVVGRGETWLEGARGALLERYVAARIEAIEREALTRWTAEACVVPLGTGVAAVAAGLPSDDEDELRAWADGIARAVLRGGYRRVVLGGLPPARRALAEALRFAGITLETTLEGGWKLWPWKRR